MNTDAKIENIFCLTFSGKACLDILSCYANFKYNLKSKKIELGSMPLLLTHLYVFA